MSHSMPRTRFAPSPTGFLHLGHARSALFAWAAAGRGGSCLLRIEDIDPDRCRPAFEAQIYQDLSWLGLSWPQPVRRQSEHLETYRQALLRLVADGLAYPCFCSRAEIQARATRVGPEGPVYDGQCRELSPALRAERLARGDSHAIRLDVTASLARTGTLYWTDRQAGRVEATPQQAGDPVIGRRDVPTSYHLSVTVDDRIQEIELVPRGMDLFEATHIHRLLQALLDLPVPEYWHHALVLDADGRKLSKRDGSTALVDLRAAGTTADEVRRRVEA